MKKLDDMMNHYNLNDTEIPGEPLTDAEKKLILNQTLAKAGLNASSGTPSAAGQSAASAPARKSRRRVFVMGAACVLILALAAVSFAAIALDKNFFSFFNASNQIDKDLLGNLGTLINKQVSDNGVTIDVKEAVGDGNSVNILFDVIAPEGTVLDGDCYSFNNALIDLPGSQRRGAGYYFEQLADGNPTDNKITMMLCYETDSNLSGKTMRFQLSDLTAPKTDEEMAQIDALPPRDEPGTPGDEYDSSKIVLLGNWNIQFPLQYKDTSTVVKPNAAVTLLGGVCKIKQVRYSPISVTLTIKGDPLRQDETMPPEELAAKYGPDGTVDQPIEVTLEDGSLAATNGTGSSIDHNRLTVTCQFTQVVNPADIVSISYAGTVISLNRQPGPH